MALDLEEQEQLATLKDWWVNYGRWIAVALAVLLLAFVGYRMYGNYQTKVAGQAADIYNELINSAAAKDLPTVLKTTENLQANYGSTAYASMAGLLAANLANAVGDRAGAIKQLSWVEDKAVSEGLENMARSRLVTLLLDAGDDASLAKADTLLKKSPASGFEALQLERRGDWYLVKNQAKEALSSYKDAWEAASKARAKTFGQKELDPTMRELEKRNPDEAQRLLKVKIDSLGGF
jgi:predicted negative regulator of RcsB-dependent stress response